MSEPVTEVAHAARDPRIEHDLLGEKAVPIDAYYGVQTARALENFVISGVPLSLDRHLIIGLAMVKMAAARVIANRALELMGHRKGEYVYCDPHDHVNGSQSTNDA